MFIRASFVLYPCQLKHSKALKTILAALGPNTEQSIINPPYYPNWFSKLVQGNQDQPFLGPRGQTQSGMFSALWP